MFDDTTLYVLTAGILLFAFTKFGLTMPFYVLVLAATYIIFKGRENYIEKAEFQNTEAYTAILKELLGLKNRITDLEKKYTIETQATARERKNIYNTLAMQTEQRRFDNINLSNIVDRHAGLSGTVTPAPH